MDEAGIDFELLPDVIDEVKDHLPLLEHDLHRLVLSPSNAELLASAFRHMHTIKGDFAYCRATRTMEFVHQLEGILQSLRAHAFNCSALVAEALLQSLDQVADMMQGLVQGREFEVARQETLVELIQQLAAATGQMDADDAARRILLAAHTEWIEAPGAEAEPLLPAVPASYARALAQGKLLAEALEERCPTWSGRAALQLNLVLALNRQYHKPCHVESLTLAVYWHDLGLLAVPDRVLQAFPTWKSPDWPIYCVHPERSASWLLEVAPDAQDAAQMIRQHHQWANGAGFPPSADKRPPSSGAMMLACADLLHERVAGLQGEDYRRGILRAVFDVNGGLDNRFDAQVINAFQNIARDLMPHEH